MLKIIYLHGLESNQGGEKVDYLAANHYVFAPALNYKASGLLEQVDSLIDHLSPDVIIGSSMGGYLANELSLKFAIPAILLNPALLNPPIKLNLNFPEKQVSDKLLVTVLGKNDEVIPFESTLSHLQKNSTCPIDLRDYGHRTPLEEFKDICERYLSPISKRNLKPK